MTTDIMAPPKTGLDVLRAAAGGDLEAPPAAALLGWRALSIEPGHVRVEYTARGEFCNPMGNIQGGFLTAMLDDAMGPAAFTLLGADEFAPTLNISVSFLSPAKPGKLIADGRVVSKGRTVVFMEGSLAMEDGTLVATATATAKIIGPSGNGGTG